MEKRAVFYQLTHKLVNSQEKIPEDARQVIYYSLDDAHIAKILTDGFAHASERRRGGGRG